MKDNFNKEPNCCWDSRSYCLRGIINCHLNIKSLPSATNDFASLININKMVTWSTTQKYFIS